MVSTVPVNHHHRHRRDDNLVCGSSPCPNPIRLEFHAFGLELFGIVLGDIIDNVVFIIILSLAPSIVESSMLAKRRRIEW